MSMRMECSASRSRMAAAIMESPRYWPQALSLRLEETAVEVSVAAIDEVEEEMGGGGLVIGALELAEADVVDDEEARSAPAVEAARVGAVGEAGIEIVDEIDAAGVADSDVGLAGAQGDGLEEVALAGAGLAGDDDVLGAVEEAEGGELLDDGTLELGLKGPVEGFEGLAVAQAALVDASLYAALALAGSGAGEDTLEQGQIGRRLGRSPGQVGIHVGIGEIDQSECPDVFSESGAERVAGGVLGAGSLGGWHIELSPGEALAAQGSRS